MPNKVKEPKDDSKEILKKLDKIIELLEIIASQDKSIGSNNLPG